jgi:4-oxalocrotonate tautomerase family enzyme
MPVVILKTRKGLSREQKRRIVSEFTKTLVSTTGIIPELVTILIEEHELEDIGKAGKLRVTKHPSRFVF